MRGRIISDWSKVDFHNPDSRLKMTGALNYFMREPDRKDSPIRKALQHFTTKGDFPTEILQILEKFHEVPAYDMGYEQIFDIRDFSGTNESGFKILDVLSALTFSKIKTGEKAKVYQAEGSAVDVSFDMYGGGLNWDRKLIDDKQYWALEDNAVEFRNKAYYSRAYNFYALVDAVSSGENITWQAVTPTSVATTNENYNAIRDINTINAAVLQIISDLKDVGLGLTANSTFVLLCPIALKSRIQRALSLLQQPVVGSGQHLAFNVQPLYTTMLSSSSVYYIIYPKAKMKGGYRMDLTIFDQFDITAYVDTMVGWMRYGGAIGNVNQVKRCATS